MARDKLYTPPFDQDLDEEELEEAPEEEEGESPEEEGGLPEEEW